jgi:outer membrane protein assembly factor BamB
MTPIRPLRLWPGVILAITLVAAYYVVPVIAADVEVAEMPLEIVSMLSGLVLAVAIVIWWLFFSRAPWVERLGAAVLMIAGVAATWFLVDESIRGGHMGMTLFLYTPPVLALALVVWAALTRRMSDRVRRATLVATIVLACLPFTLIRTAGVIGAASEFHWRWTPTPEERLLAQAQDEPVAVVPLPDAAPAPVPAPEPPVAAPPAENPVAAAAKVDEAGTPVLTERKARVEGRAEWPGFRGPNRDSVIRGMRINTDWSASPPAELWRKPIGPGWSSFAVNGDLLYTQEQRGEEEVVSCYRVSTGEPVWRHRDPARF